MNLDDILLSDNVVECINNNLDYLLVLVPEIQYMIGFDQKHPHHHLDVWNHTLLALSLSQNDFDIRLCLLLHDIGKPFSYQEGEVRHFKGHAETSSKIARVILKRLNYPSGYIEYICYLVLYHDTPITDDFIKNNRELAIKLYKIQYCDALAHNPLKLEKRKEYLDSVQKRLLMK